MLDTLSPVLELIKDLTPKQKEFLYTHLQELEICAELEGLTIEEIRHLDHTITRCPRCLSSNIIGWGKHRERKRYMCKNCDRTFNELTGIPKLRENGIHDHNKLKKYIHCMIEGQSLRACSETVGICLHTAFFWRHKMLRAFENIDTQWLKKEIQADETFILESAKGDKDIVTNHDRKPRKRGGTATTAGITKEHTCIMGAVDAHGNTLLQVAGQGRLTKDMVKDTLGKKIRKQRKNQAILVTDRHVSYKELVKQKKLIHQTVIAQYKQYINVDGFNPEASGQSQCLT